MEVRIISIKIYPSKKIGVTVANHLSTNMVELLFYPYLPPEIAREALGTLGKDKVEEMLRGRPIKSISPVTE